MLEEALNSNTFPPADSALAMLSFVRYELPAGGANAEARFFRLFSLLCDRIFGAMSGPTDNFRHEPGGWLSRSQRWSRPTPSSSRSPPVAGAIHSSATQGLDYDPVVQLLASVEALKAQKDGNLPTLIEAISAEAQHRPGIRYPFPLLALPKPTQQVVLASVQSAITGKPVDASLRENAVRLFGSLLLVSPRDQGSLKNYEQKQSLGKADQPRSLSLNPGLVLSPRSTNAVNSTANAKDDKDKKSEDTAKIMLSMLEFYLFTFIRFPLDSPLPNRSPQAPPPATPSSPPGVNRHLIRSKSSSLPYGEQVYLHLFRGYLKHFLPFGPGQVPFLGFPDLIRVSELFVRIVIEFWLEGNTIIPTTNKAVEALKMRRSRPGASTDEPLNVTLSMSFDLVETKYDPLPPQVQRCLRSLVNHVVKNPVIPRASQECSDAARMRLAAGAAGQGDYWCIPPSMTILQQPFYNYVRVALRYASVHVARASFETALDLWLVWLEPWNVEMRKSLETNVFSCSYTHATYSLFFVFVGIFRQAQDGGKRQDVCEAIRIESAK